MSVSLKKSHHPTLDKKTFKDLCSFLWRTFTLIFNQNIFFLTTECHGPLGMQSGAIRDHQLIASSEKDNSSSVRYARLHYENKKKPKSWVPLLDHRDQWLQVNLGNELTWVTGVATQGKQGKRGAWVKNFLLRYWGAGVRAQLYKGHGDIHSKVSEIENNPWARV